MATIRKRGTRYQAQVRRIGAPALTKSFARKADASKWCREMEAAVDRGEVRTTAATGCSTVADLLRRYRDSVSVGKRGHADEKIVLNAFLKADFSQLSLSGATPDVFSAYRDSRLNQVKPATVKRQLGLLHHVFEVARTEWHAPIHVRPFG